MNHEDIRYTSTKWDDMKITMILAMLLSFAANAHSESFSVSHLPSHPMADVMGYVLSGDVDVIASEIPPYSDEPFLTNPPELAGWPVDIANEYGAYEGGMLINADSDPELEILFSTNHLIHLLDHDGTYLPGWPVLVPTGTRISGQSSFGDLDGDGSGEIVVVSDNWPNGSSAWTYAYDVSGTILTGFPVVTNGDHTKSPTVVDLDGDGKCEIIVSEDGASSGLFYIFDGAGQLLAGWPQTLDHVAASSAGAADLDNDGIKEIVFESYNSLYAFSLDGTILSGFPYTPSTGDVFSYSAPVFADVDDDGYLEIAVGGHSFSGNSHMFLLNHDGTDCSGWPKATTQWIYAPASFADMDGDGDLEIIVGDQVGSGSPANRVYAWHHDGSAVAGWPVGPIWAINAQVTVADIDGDGDPEFMWDDNTGSGKIMGYHHNGEAIAGWPITTPGSTFFQTLAVGDVDLDSDLELLSLTQISSTCSVHLWDLPDVVNMDDIQVPMFQYGPGRDGMILETPAQGVEELPSPLSEMMVTVSPNPFSMQVTITVTAQNTPSESLRIFDISGRMVREISPVTNEGSAVFNWNGKSASGMEVPDGIYPAIVTSGNMSSSVMLLKQ